MSISLLQRFDSVLRGLSRKNRLRTFSPRSGFDFASNDYLGLAGSTRLAHAIITALSQGTPVGAGGSRLLRGNTVEHEELESTAAAFFRTERALYFGGGYVANFALLTTLPQKGDLLVLDEFVHASAHEGALSGRAQVVIVTHNNVNAVDNAIQTWRKGSGMGRVWIAVESLYSMDGDRAPIDDLMALADRHDAFMLIDEAHATGVYGPDGRGLAAMFEGRDNVIMLHTCGKALGTSGALVTGPKSICDFLINRCRPFIYATAPSPLMAVASMEALAILRDEPERRNRLAELVAFAAHELTKRCGVASHSSQILPIIIGDNGRCIALAAALQARGFDIRAIRPPTVPEGTARLRISLTLNVDEKIISAMLTALAEEREIIAG